MEQFDLTTGPFAENPYPIFDRLREEAPIFWHEGLNAFVVTRYEDCKRVNEDTEYFWSSRDGKPPIPYMQWLDGADHERIRRLVAPAFAPRALASTIEPLLPRIANGLVDSFIDRGRVEVMTEFAEPMAAQTISRLLNVPAADELWVVHTAYEMLEAEANPANTELQARYPDMLARLRGFFAVHIERERKSPSGSLISALIAAESEGQRLSREELLANSMIVVIAGIETTTRLIANLLYGLIRHRDQMEAVLSDMTLLKPAIEETFRCYAPNQPIMRFVQKPVTLHGVTVGPGTRIYGFRSAANRDLRVWQDPNRFDVRRFLDKTLPSHLALGRGAHACIGSYLARAEATQAAQAFLNRTKNHRFDPERDVRFSGFRNRGPKELHVLFDKV